MNSNWHSLELKELLSQLDSDSKGLSSGEASTRLEKYGTNNLPQKEGASDFKRFMLQFHNILIYVLIGSAAITAILLQWVDTLVIMAVVITNAIIGYIQEGKAEKAMDSIRQMLAPHANVIRDNERISIEAIQLVPGDIVLLEAGDKVPADVRLIDAHGFSVQEAILTGESVPVDKHINPAKEDAALGDRTCIAHSGTLVTAGQGKGIVVATGGNTEIGRISGLISTVETLTTPLVTQMGVFAKWLTIMILVVAALLLAFGYFVKQYDFTEMFMAVVGISVAAIPEGLPAVLTITLAIGVQSMAKRNAIVRRLPAIETLGAVSVICTDKTGTLTRNEMMVASLITNEHTFQVGGIGYEPKGDLNLNGSNTSKSELKILEQIARASILCNDAEITQNDDTWTAQGDPMEGALLTFAGKMELDIKKERNQLTRSDSIPFDSKHCFMATLNHDQDKHGFIYVKGAPERILQMCKDQLDSHGKTEIIDIDYWNEKIKSIAALGQRVLALAVMPVKPNHKVLEHQDVEGTLTLLGMVGMIDPPRNSAMDAVAECHEAGIRVKMITGDHAMTAAAIGKQIGLQNPDKVITGSDLDKMDDSVLKQEALNCDIFARTTPEHKLRLVMALQSHGLTVAMTGDGVNDAPALKRADAGVAMGQKGSEAAKEAAELVLADDNFASIAIAVGEGRTVYDNIKKVISWTIPTSVGEAVTIIAALLLGMTLPITPIQILWINLITATTLGIAFAFEPKEENTMKRPPRPRDEALLNGELVWHIILVSLLFLCGVFGIYQYAISKGYSIELARTIVLNTIVVMEIFHLFFVRNIYGTSITWQAIKGTKVVWTVIIIITVAQFAITYLPPLQPVFSTRNISFFDGLLIIAVGVAMFAITEIEKQIRLAFKRSNIAN